MTRAQVTRDLFQFRHLTVPAETSDSVARAATTAFRDLAARLQAGGIEPLQEKVYGPLAHKDEILAIRREVLAQAGLDPELPCTFTAGRRDEDLGFAGIQLWGVAARDGAPVQVETVHFRNGVVGRQLQSPDLRLLHLSHVHGNPTQKGLPQGVADQAGRMFENADAALSEAGFGFRNVVRTWIYLTRLLDWYGEFNRVRFEFLRSRSITDDSAYPASTGIQGTDGDGECLMDVLAVDGQDARIRPITDTSRQQRPMSYGSSFSRGLGLRCADTETVFVSGTASIDGAGQTLHCWHRESQVLETLLSVAALLEDQGATLADIRLATIFCKDRETLELFERVTRQLGIEKPPMIPVLADVCRPELMVEIEAMAVLPGGQKE